jgi:ribosome-interacting GTPase 1
VRGVRRIVEDEGHLLNERKTRVRPAAVRQSVTGIVVNQATNVSRADYDSLRAILHNAAVHGPQSQNHGALPDFRAHLLGRISWVESLNPSRGARLRDTFRTIPW